MTHVKARSASDPHIVAMGPRFLTLVLVVFVTACGAAAGDQAPPPATGVPSRAPAPQPGDVAPDLRVPPYLPAPPPLPAPYVPPTPAPTAAAPSYAPGLPSGPVTNYGTGGMQAPPGSGPNPPYPPGGLVH
jgi:hypothetical protein